MYLRKKERKILQYRNQLHCFAKHLLKKVLGSFALGFRRYVFNILFQINYLICFSPPVFGL